MKTIIIHTLTESRLESLLKALKHSDLKHVKGDRTQVEIYYNDDYDLIYLGVAYGRILERTEITSFVRSKLKKN